MNSNHTGVLDARTVKDHQDEYDQVITYCEQYGVTLQHQAVLVLGCGDGRFAEALTNKQCLVTGIDPSEEKIKQAIDRKTNILYRRANAEYLPFERDHFDVVIAYEVWHLFDRPKVLSEMNRVLRRNGKLLILEEKLLPRLAEDVEAYFPSQWYEEWEQAQWQILHKWQMNERSSPYNQVTEPHRDYYGIVLQK